MSTLVKSARKDHGRCHGCALPILKGQSYYHYSANRFAQTFAWHAGCPAPTAGQMESNETRQIAMLGAEGASDDLDSLESKFKTEDAETLVADVKNILDVFATELSSAAESAREKQQNIEDGFGHETDRSNELMEWGEAYEGLVDEIENWDPDESDWADYLERAKVDDEEPNLDEVATEFLNEVLESAREAIMNAEGEFP